MLPLDNNILLQQFILSRQQLVYFSQLKGQQNSNHISLKETKIIMVILLLLYIIMGGRGIDVGDKIPTIYPLTLLATGLEKEKKRFCPIFWVQIALSFDTGTFIF
eukprot:TRINITY_DN6517_c1_g1_i1.p8 TRINITY_DN6517_c1_g1~~TRINITY_DN6517_c1_g1_i1.p8  ORF type:complete len:105 (+),score=7.19 TRINITY_DN6517_c1_g1_i1:1258-1572(+)